MKETQPSSALTLMSLLWDHQEESRPHSWVRLNGQLREGLFLACDIGLRFGIEDFYHFDSRFRTGYWYGENGLETFYARAVFFSNNSAWQALEHYKGRKPFIWTPSELTLYGGGRCSNPARLTVGAKFTWKNEQVIVTSFHDEGEPYLVACSYTNQEGRCCDACGTQVEWPREKILHRYTITHADLRAGKKAKHKAEVTNENT